LVKAVVVDGGNPRECASACEVRYAEACRFPGKVTVGLSGIRKTASECFPTSCSCDKDRSTAIRPMDAKTRDIESFYLYIYWKRGIHFTGVVFKEQNLIVAPGLLLYK